MINLASWQSIAIINLDHTTLSIGGNLVMHAHDWPFLLQASKQTKDAKL